MKIIESKIKKIKIIEPEEDSITIHYEETYKEDRDCWQAQVIIISDFGFTVNYFWNAMGLPLKQFFCNAATSYLVDKFMQDAGERCTRNELEKTIERVKTAFKQMLKQSNETDA